MKYEFTGEIKQYKSLELKQIRRVSDGLVGGWIENESNLSQEGNCFVYGDAEVSGDAKVYGDFIYVKSLNTPKKVYL